MYLFTVPLVVAIGVVSSCYGYPSNQPVIGVLLETTSHSYRSCHGGQYKVLSSYKSFIEQGGGGAVPVFVSQPDEYYEKLIPRLNGVLLTGGGGNLITSPYGKAAYKIFRMAKTLNDAGTSFPIWGTCLGMQEMSTWPFSPRQNLCTLCANTERVSLPLNFTAAANSSKLFGVLPNYLKNILAKERVTANYHHACLSAKTYATSKPLNQFYSVLSTNYDGKNLEFVSSYEARSYPFFGVQWHPERNNFLHSPSTKINQDLNAVLVGQYFGNFLVEQAKRNHHRFRSAAEESRFLLNSYQTHFNYFVEYYCFNDSDVPKFDD